jgi:hypothetical protein
MATTVCATGPGYRTADPDGTAAGAPNDMGGFMSRIVRTAVVAVIALLALAAVASPAAAQTSVTGHATFAAADGGSVVGGSYVITDASGTILRQGTIGDAEKAIFFGTFVSGETYTLTAVADGYQQVSQTLTATDEIRFGVVLEPLEMTKKTITIGIDKNSSSGWFLAEAPEGSTWTLTEVTTGKVYTGTFSGVLPQAIPLDSAVGSGTYLVQVDAGPTFLPYEATVTMQGNSSALYFGLTPDTSVVPM